jgi:hypothetical protein
MELEAGKTYRAKAATGEMIQFTVVHVAAKGWVVVDLDSLDGPEPNVMLNTNLLLWISSETRRTVALSKAADEVIEALEKNNL